jgi:predicted permease
MTSLLLNGFYASSLSTFHWLAIAVLGVAAKKLEFVDKDLKKYTDNNGKNPPEFKGQLSKVVTNIILPFFILSQIVNNFRISQYLLIIQAVIGCLVIYLFGLLVGFAIAKILKLNKAQQNFLGALFSTPHNTSIYVILIQVIGPFLDTIFPRNPNIVGNSVKRGLLYVIINSIVANIWKWSCCYYLIEPDDEMENSDDDKQYALLNDNDQTNNLAEIKPKYKPKTFKDILKSVINMPLIASLISLFITFIPKLQLLFITPKSILQETVMDVSKTVSKAYSFLVIFILGLSISDNVHLHHESIKNIGKNFLDKTIIFWLTLVKLVIMPIITTPVIIYIFRNIFHSDDVLTFNYLFLGAAPPAINIIVICAYKGAFTKEISAIMIVMYTAAIITLTLNITGFLYILGMLNAPIIAAQNAAKIPIA